MRIVHVLEKKRGLPQGPHGYLSTANQAYFSTGRNGGNECYRRAEKLGIARPEEGTSVAGHNFIVEAALRAEDDCFIDTDTGWPYLSVDDSMHSIVKAIGDGTLRFANGVIAGLFTFKPHSWGQGYMAIRAFTGPLPQNKAAKPSRRRAVDPAAGVPDLSDFVKSLAQEP